MRVSEWATTNCGIIHENKRTGLSINISPRPYNCSYPRWTDLVILFKLFEGFLFGLVLFSKVADDFSDLIRYEAKRVNNGQSRREERRERSTHPIPIRLQGRNNVLHGALDENATYKAKALPIGLLLQRFVQRGEHQAIPQKTRSQFRWCKKVSSSAPDAPMFFGLLLKLSDLRGYALELRLQSAVVLLNLWRVDEWPKKKVKQRSVP